MNLAFVRKPVDNFVISLPLFNHLQTCHPVSQPYTPKMQLAFLPDVHYKSGKIEAPKVWILTTAPSAVTTAITLICPGETTKFITIKKPIHILWLPPAWSATSSNFHLPPCYESPTLEVNISLDMENLNMINISSLDFHIWQHQEKHQSDSQLQHLASIPSVPVNQLYRHMTNGIQYITPFTSSAESTGETASIWTLFSYTGVYEMAIGLVIPAGLGIFCCYFFWCWPARLVHQPKKLGTMLYTIVDDDVEAASIYRCNSKAQQPTRPHKNHGLHMEWVPMWMESQYKQQMQSLVVPAQRSLAITSKIHAIHNCGWWCRGSIHLQMQQQGPTTYKTSQESWPAYGVSTYVDGESI